MPALQGVAAQRRHRIGAAGHRQQGEHFQGEPNVPVIGQVLNDRVQRKVQAADQPGQVSAPVLGLPVPAAIGDHAAVDRVSGRGLVWRAPGRDPPATLKLALEGARIGKYELVHRGQHRAATTWASREFRLCAPAAAERAAGRRAQRLTGGARPR